MQGLGNFGSNLGTTYSIRILRAAVLRGFHRFDGTIELSARGQERSRWQRPAVILHVGEFDAGGAGGFDEREHFSIWSMCSWNHENSGYGNGNLCQPVEDAELFARELWCRRFRWRFLRVRLELSWRWSRPASINFARRTSSSGRPE